MSDETTTASAETPVTEPGSRDAAIAALKEMREPAAETPKDAPVAEEKPAAEAEHEVAIAPEKELATKIRGRLANIEAKERELNERIAQREREVNERAAQVEKQNATFQESLNALRNLAQNDPSRFLEQTGVDLNGLVKAKLIEGKPEAVAERAMRELSEFRKQMEAERAAEKQAAAEREQTAARQSQEQSFLDLAKPESMPFLARLARKNPALAIQNGYLISGIMQRENGGKIPPMEELVKRVDAELRAAYADDDAPAETPAASKNGITPKKAAAAVVVKSPEDMTPAEKRAEAMRLLREMRKASA